jgi:predicted metal-dependent hydrolase
MADSRTIHVDGVGLILFERSIRARRVIISVKPYERVRVAIPNRVSFKSALNFVNLKKPWIQKHLVRIKRMESQRQAVNSSVIIDKVKAKKKLTNRLKQLAVQHGFTYNKVYIRNQKTRWGSCSSKNNISLNIKLVLLSDKLVDYVILHELVHTKIHNHSKRFWGELDKYVGDGKVMAKRLREYGLRLL